jgi:hypothetical protein
MRGGSVWGAILLSGLLLPLGACAHHNRDDGERAVADGRQYPVTYKSDIIAAMHAYLRDPTGIRDAAVAEPSLKSNGSDAPTHYTACLRFNAKKSATEYAGVKEVAAVFLSGRFDRFVETPHELCADAVYAPFPELQNLPP